MLRDWQSRDLVASVLRNPRITGRVSCDAKWAASGFNGLHVCEDTIGSDLYDHIDGRLCEIQVTVRPRRDSLRLDVGCGHRELRDPAARRDPTNDVFELVHKPQVAIRASGDGTGIVRTSHGAMHGEEPTLSHAADHFGETFAEPQRAIRTERDSGRLAI